jgi:phosphate/sulfate permease
MDTLISISGLVEAAPWILVAIFALIVFQEAVNGFHDTANAVATVIYSNSLQPIPAVAIAAVGNFIGVVIGGTAVAFTLVYMLPSEMVAGINTAWEASLLLALIVTAVSWNFGTWWFGIPNSTTHTYVGSIMGVAVAHAFLIGEPVAEQLNLHKAQSIFITLLVSPIVGFALAWIFLVILRRFLKDPAMYKPAERTTRPPRWVRSILIAGSAGVSVLHGSNDGQKSIGLMMLVLFALAPVMYGLNPSRLNAEQFANGLEILQEVESIAGSFVADPQIGEGARAVMQASDRVKRYMQEGKTSGLTTAEALQMRYDILDLHKRLGNVERAADRLHMLSRAQVRTLDSAYERIGAFVEGVPFWVILVSALALGGGTAVGYRKIVETLGEKMGSSHMNPAQGTAAQLAAIAGIAMADLGHMPVSTTHVLSAGVTGTVVASPGEKVNWGTLRKIMITWVTTLPGCMVLAFALGIFFNVAFA